VNSLSATPVGDQVAIRSNTHVTASPTPNNATSSSSTASTAFNHCTPDTQFWNRAKSPYLTPTRLIPFALASAPPYSPWASIKSNAEAKSLSSRVRTPTVHRPMWKSKSSRKQPCFAGRKPPAPGESVNSNVRAQCFVYLRADCLT
jgi:hypothetical protein